MKYTYPLPAAYATAKDPMNYDENGFNKLIFPALRNYKAQLHFLSEEEVDAQAWFLGQFPIKHIIKCAVDTAANTVTITITHEQKGLPDYSKGRFVKKHGVIMFERPVKPVIF